MGQLKKFIYPEDKNSTDGKVLSSEIEEKLQTKWNYEITS